MSILLAEEDYKVEVAKGVSCKFYQDGKCPACKFCLQPEDTVLACADAYVELMKVKEADVWSPELEQIEDRDTLHSVNGISIGLLCDTCYLAETCPFHKAKSTCGIEWKDKDFNPTDVKGAMSQLIALQHERITRAKMIELADGGVPDQILSAEMDRMSGLLSTLQGLNQSGFNFSISATGEGAKAAPGILSTIFGLNKPEPALPEKPADAIDITPAPEAETVEFVEIEKKRLAK